MENYVKLPLISDDIKTPLGWIVHAIRALYSIFNLINKTKSDLVYLNLMQIYECKHSIKV